MEPSSGARTNKNKNTGTTATTVVQSGRIVVEGLFALTRKASRGWTFKNTHKRGTKTKEAASGLLLTPGSLS
jgi:hypothetical protein